MSLLSKTQFSELLDNTVIDLPCGISASRQWSAKGKGWVVACSINNQSKMFYQTKHTPHVEMLLLKAHLAVKDMVSKGIRPKLFGVKRIKDPVRCLSANVRLYYIQSWRVQATYPTPEKMVTEIVYVNKHPSEGEVLGAIDKLETLCSTKTREFWWCWDNLLDKNIAILTKLVNSLQSK